MAHGRSRKVWEMRFVLPFAAPFVSALSSVRPPMTNVSLIRPHCSSQVTRVPLTLLCKPTLANKECAGLGKKRWLRQTKATRMPSVTAHSHHTHEHADGTLTPNTPPNARCPVHEATRRPHQPFAQNVLTCLSSTPQVERSRWTTPHTTARVCEPACWLAVVRLLRTAANEKSLFREVRFMDLVKPQIDRGDVVAIVPFLLAPLSGGGLD